jgi:hypothetical protein
MADSAALKRSPPHQQPPSHRRSADEGEDVGITPGSRSIGAYTSPSSMSARSSLSLFASIVSMPAAAGDGVAGRPTEGDPIEVVHVPVTGSSLHSILSFFMASARLARRSAKALPYIYMR